MIYYKNTRNLKCRPLLNLRFRDLSLQVPVWFYAVCKMLPRKYSEAFVTKASYLGTYQRFRKTKTIKETESYTIRLINV